MMLAPFVAFAAIAQTPFAAAMDKTVSLEVMRAPLGTILSDLSLKTGVPITLKFRQEAFSDEWQSVGGTDLSTTALVVDRPLRHVLEALASVHGLQVRLMDSGVQLETGTGLDLLGYYIKQENQVFLRRANEKLWALARLTKQPFVPRNETANSSEHLEDPLQWAKQRIGRWPYYLAGMWRNLPQNRARQLYWGTPEGFWVGMPETKAQDAYGRSWIDENSAALAEDHAVFVISPISFQIRAAGVYPETVDPEPPFERPYQLPNVPADLKGSPFAKYLREWEADEKTLEDPFLQAQTVKATSSSPERWDGRTSVADILFSFYKENRVSIVADAFRISSLKGVGDVTGRTRRDWLLKLKSNEQCYVGFKNQIAMIRHPAFWRLQQTEPTQASLDRIEALAKKRPLNLLDYAEFLASNRVYTRVRFDAADSGLYHFDTRPLTASAPALYALGLLSPGARSQLLRGEVYAFTDRGPLRDSRDSLMVNLAVAWGPFYGARVAGVSRLLLQDGWPSLLYSGTRGYDKRLPEGVGPMLASRVWLQSDAEARNLQIYFGHTPRDYSVYKVAAP